MTALRIGHGYDVHRFCEPAEQRPLIIGGVTIEHDRGLAAHSDGDVLIHALCDALLGAAGQGDIGRHFPDNDPAFAGADSAGLLSAVVDRLAREGWQAVNADITVVAQAPRMGPYIEPMRARLAELIGCPRQCVNIKATTTEGMGPLGRREGIAVHAVALIGQ